MRVGNPYFIAYAYWTSGSAHSHTPLCRALAHPACRGLDYVRQHRVDFFLGFYDGSATDDALTTFACRH